MSRRFTHSGQGAPACATSRKRRQVGGPVLVPVGEEPLEMGRHAEHRGRPLLGDRGRDALAGSKGPGTHDPSAGEQRAHREAQRRGVVDRAEHQVHVVGREAPQVALLGEQRLGLGRVEQPGEHSLGPARRAAGEVDRPSPGRPDRRVVGQRLRAAPRAASCVVTTSAGSRSASRASRSLAVSFTSIGTGKTPRRSRAITSSAYATDPGTSSATRSPGARSCGSTASILSAVTVAPKPGQDDRRTAHFSRDSLRAGLRAGRLRLVGVLPGGRDRQ